MKRLKILLFVIVPTICLCQIDTVHVLSKRDEINSLNDICKQVKDVNETLFQSKENLTKVGSELSSNIGQEISTQTDSLTKAISNLNRENREEEPFSWLQFISGAFIEALGAFIGFGGALFLYYHQRTNDNKKEKYLTEKQDKSRVNYLNILTKDSLLMIENQIERVNENNARIKNEILYLYQPDLYPTEDLERLKNLLDNPDYFNSYVNIIGGTYEDTKKFRRIVGTNDYFLNQFKELRKTDAIEFDHKRKLLYKKLFEESLKAVADFGESNENSNPKLFSDINKILHNYHINRVPEEVETHQEFFIDPAKELLLNNYYEIEEAKMCLELLKNTTQTYHDIIMQNQHYLKKYELMYDTMIDTYEKMNESTNKLKSYS